MTALFVAGAGTDVGKTHVTAGLIRSLRARGAAVSALKPLVSGFDPGDWTGSDPGRLLQALGRPLTAQALDSLSPWRYRAPLSPDMAAGREGQSIDFDGILNLCRQRIAAAGDEILLIEGVGGVMSPVSPTTTNLDWMVALGAPILLVTGSYLGSISHTLTAAAVIRGAGLSLSGIVVSQSAGAETPFEDTLASLERLSGAKLFGVWRDQSVEAWAPAILDGAFER
ncbi:MAG TPA: dethiobiotin synthase [Caulobacteraceae bacterium]|jgi:dethiobiotin synthetase